MSHEHSLQTKLTFYPSWSSAQLCRSSQYTSSDLGSPQPTVPSQQPVSSLAQRPHYRLIALASLQSGVPRIPDAGSLYTDVGLGGTMRVYLSSLGGGQGGMGAPRGARSLTWMRRRRGAQERQGRLMRSGSLGGDLGLGGALGMTE